MPENKGKEPTLQPGLRRRPGAGGGADLRNTPADEFLSREVHGNSAFPASPVQTPGGAKRELGYDRGVASGQGGARRRPRGVRARWRESGGGKARGRESKTRASRPRAAPAAPKPSRRGPFSVPAAKARRALGQGREPGASRVRGALTPGRGDEGRPSGWPLPPGTLPPPHPFHLARGLRPRIPDPRGTGPGDGEETRRAPRRAAPPPGGRRGAPCEREASGSAALPGGGCGASAALRRRTPPPAASRRAPGGRRGRAIYKCKGLIVVLCSGDTIVYGAAGLPGARPGLAARAPLPAPRGLALGS